MSALSALPSGQAIDTSSGTGTIDSMVIGSTTPAAATVTALAATTATITTVNATTIAGRPAIARDAVTTVTSTSNATTINLSTSAVFKHTFTENTTFTFSNPLATGNEDSFTLWLFQDGTGRTPTWPASVKWSNATPPVLNNANKNYLLSFSTIDGGTTWGGLLVLEAYA